MVKRFFSSLYWKISAIFLMLLVVVGGVNAYLTLFTAEMYVQEATQKVSAPLARRIVEEVTMIEAGEVNEQVAEEVFLNASMLNPGIEIYLIDPEGTVMASSVPAANVRTAQIALEPIRSFLDAPESAFLTGDDPLNPGERKVFSAAPVLVSETLQGYVYVILRGDEYDSALDMLQDSYILRYGRSLLLVSLIAAAVLGLIVIRLLTRKLRRIRAAVEAFEAGTYDYRIPITSSDELDELARAFNSMAATTLQHVEEITRTDALRRELVANVSHDLRTPLASVQGYVETLLLKDEELTGSERRDYLEVIRRASQRLGRLVGQLFELSKLDARQSEPDREPFSFPELAHDVAQKFAPRAQKKNVDVRVHAGRDVPLAHGDVGMLERALENLIDNAVRYAPRGSRVEVDVARDGDMVRVEVSDEGPGIPSEEQSNIFDRFYRLDKSRTAEHKGAGLGLAITRKIAEAHAGTVELAADGGGGSTFVLRIPAFRDLSTADREQNLTPA
jgi:signal transduction histidine kinase